MNINERRFNFPNPGDEIVISGVSGCFPNSENVDKYRDNLFNHAELISECRWNVEDEEMPTKGGLISDIDKFDASFFGFQWKQAHASDCMLRIILERTFEAIVDAGLNPNELKGTRTGVFIATSFSESEIAGLYDKGSSHGYAILGCVRGMIPNRISYWLGVNGPSYLIDTACSSSLFAFEQAYFAIKNNQCDSAIVGGCNVCLASIVTLQFARLGILNKDGKCKCFDESADGYTRSEAVAVVLLQKVRNARRIYAQVIHAKTNCDGFKEEGITFPSRLRQGQLICDSYKECRIEPCEVEYVEAHITGTKVGDPEEIAAIDTAFCKEFRQKPLLIGSVKSHIGHTEPAAGLCSIIRVLITMETGYHIPVINYEKPRRELTAIERGRIKIITEKLKYNDGYIGVNNFGFGGANCHVVLKPFSKNKLQLKDQYVDNLPRLINISGRTKEAVNCIINDVASHEIDIEFIALLHKVFRYDIQGHIYRGYTLLNNEELITRELNYYSSEKKSLWLVFGNPKKEYFTKVAKLMSFPIFSEIIRRCHQILITKGVNLIELIMKNSDKFLNIKEKFVITTSIQISFIDTLKSIHIYPDKVKGYSIGLLACAYFDKSLTLEQTILCSFYFSDMYEESSNYQNETVVNVETNYNQFKNFLQDGIKIFSSLDGTSHIITGKLNDMKIFAEQLLYNRIPFYEEDYKNLGLHWKLKNYRNESKYLENFLVKLEQVLGMNGKYLLGNNICYNKLLNISSPQLLLENMYDEIPENVILLSMSPEDLFGYLRTSGSLKLSLFQEQQQDIIKSLLTIIGRLYMMGFNSQIDKLYPLVAFPVNRGTKMISPLIKWDHSHSWSVALDDAKNYVKGHVEKIRANAIEYKYLQGHMIDGRVLYPATGYLDLVWKTLKLASRNMCIKIPIVFKNVKFHRATHLSQEGVVNLTVTLQANGQFEITEDTVIVVTGQAYTPIDVTNESVRLPIQSLKSEEYDLKLSSDDIYKELGLRGYNYKGLFRGIKSCGPSATMGEIYWNNNMVTFIDSMLQLSVLQEDTRELYVPVYIQYLLVDIDKHERIIANMDENKTLLAYGHKHVKTIVCGGVEIRGLRANSISKRKILEVPVLEAYKFVPNVLNKILSLEESVRVMVQLALENLYTCNVKTVEIFDDELKNRNEELPIISAIIEQVLHDLPLLKANINVFTTQSLNLDGVTVSDGKIITETECLLIIGTQMFKRPQMLTASLNALLSGGFLITREPLLTDFSSNVPTRADVIIIQEYTLEFERLVMFRKKTAFELRNCIDVSKYFDCKFDWVPILRLSIQSDKNTLIYAQGDNTSGIIGFANCLLKEPELNNIQCVFIMDDNAPKFNLQHEFYIEQLEKGLTLNVYKNGAWGTYRHLLLENNKKELDVEDAFVNITVRGEISSLKWIQNEHLQKSENDTQKLVYIYYSAVNFRDIMLASGCITADVVTDDRISQSHVLGLEFSGRLKNGIRVMGITFGKGLATTAIADNRYIWEVPADWTLEDAATVPVVYETVIYALIWIGKIKKGMSILIHSGAGGVGQAALNIASFFECNIFTTVGNNEKREFIKQHWPQVKDTQIGNSRDTSFERMIKTETQGRGVDLVLNSLANDKLQASIRCLARFGKFLEIGKFDLSKDNPMPLEIMKKGASYHGITLDNFNEKLHKNLFRLMKIYLKTCAIKPLQRCVFQKNEVQNAFRYMTSGKHIGKVLIQIRKEEMQEVTIPLPINVKAIPQYVPTNVGSYIISGGIGGFGLELVDWLILRGAQKFILVSRNGVTTGYQAMRIRIWKSYGIELIISNEDTASYNGCLKVIKQALELGPVEGIFNLAAILQDSLFKNQTEENFAKPFKPKAIATKYFDEISRRLCSNLRKFVVFSSMSCGRGNVGQTNYGMANSAIERICELRQQDGFPALAIQWGAIGDVGLVAQMQEQGTELVIGGTSQQRIASCLTVLDKFLTQENTIVSSMIVAEKKDGIISPTNSFGVLLNILGINNLKTVNIHTSLAEMGMDSIMAVEIKQILERDMNLFLTAREIRTLTFSRLQDLLNNTTDTIQSTRNKVEVQFIRNILEDETELLKPYVVHTFGNTLYVFQSIVKENASDFKILLPGIEGIAVSMKTLACRLTDPAICMQFNLRESDVSISAMAISLFDHTLSHLKNPAQMFTLVGYSYGGLVTLELAKLLEAEGRRGQLILIDGAPTMLKELVHMSFNLDTEEQFQNSILTEILNKFAKMDSMHNLLNDCKSWEEKINVFISILKRYHKYKDGNVWLVCNAIYKRLKAILNYEPNDIKLKSSITLIRTKNIINTDVSEDFGLSCYTEGTVQVVYIDGTHTTIINEPQCAEEINKIFRK